MKSQQIFHLPVSLTTVKEHCARGRNSCKAHPSSPDVGACHLFVVICRCENSRVRAHEIKFRLKGMKAVFGHLHLFIALSCRLNNCFLLLLLSVPPLSGVMQMLKIGERAKKWKAASGVVSPFGSAAFTLQPFSPSTPHQLLRSHSCASPPLSWIFLSVFSWLCA